MFGSRSLPGTRENRLREKLGWETRLRDRVGIFLFSPSIKTRRSHRVVGYTQTGSRVRKLKCRLNFVGLRNKFGNGREGTRSSPLAVEFQRGASGGVRRNKLPPRSWDKFVEIPSKSYLTAHSRQISLRFRKGRASRRGRAWREERPGREGASSWNFSPFGFSWFAYHPLRRSSRLESPL